jgi:hypothetical protein
MTTQYFVNPYKSSSLTNQEKIWLHFNARSANARGTMPNCSVVYRLSDAIHDITQDSYDTTWPEN